MGEVVINNSRAWTHTHFGLASQKQLLVVSRIK